MTRLYWLFAFGLAVLVATPQPSQAFWNSPQVSHGFGWLEGVALRWNASIHFHGPLYSYGPYTNVPGYNYMNVYQPFCGAYVPAYPAAYYGIPNPRASANGFYSWNGTAVQLGYPNGLSLGMQPAPATSPSDYFTDGVLNSPPPLASSTSNYYGAPAPGYFQQPLPSQVR